MAGFTALQLELCFLFVLLVDGVVVARLLKTSGHAPRHTLYYRW